MNIDKMRVDELLTKQHYTRDLGKAISAYAQTSIQELDYDVFLSSNSANIYEYLVVVYKGGAVAVRNCGGNSFSAIFDEVGRLFNGGYYDEVSLYFDLKKDSISLANLISKD